MISRLSGEKFDQARLNQSVFEAQSVRTLKSSTAAIGFLDGFELRINQRTELVLQSTATLRKMRLSSGAVWVRVAPGIRVEVETPVLTAAVRGTQFEISSAGELKVYEGIVEAENQTGTWSVSAGQILHIVDGKWTLESLAAGQLPRSLGGPTEFWHEKIILEREDLTSYDTDEFRALRNSDLATVIAQGGENFTRGTAIQSRFRNETQKNYLGLALGALLVWPTAPGKFHGVADLDLGVNLGHPSYANARSGFAISSGRARLVGESVVGGFLTKADWFSCFDSSLFIEREVAQNLKLRSGRLRLTNTQMPLDLFNQGLWPGPMSGVSAGYERGPARFELSWVADTDPFLQSRQSAVVISADWMVKGNHLGVTGIKSINGGLDRAMVSAVTAPLPGLIELYGNLQISTKRKNSGFGLGAHLPGLYEKWGVLGLVEYQYNSQLGSGWALYGSVPIMEHLTLELQWGMQVRGKSHCGVGLNIKF